MQISSEKFTVSTDAQLVALSRQSSREAFDELMRRHRRRCLLFAMQILRNPAEAEEACQNAFWRAYARLDQLRSDAEFLPWLLRIIETQCLMSIRQRNRAHILHLDELESEGHRGWVQLKSVEANPECAFEQDEILSAMQVEINRIPLFLRQLLILHDLDELSIQDSAVRLGISLGAARSRLLRARSELRQRMQRHYPPSRSIPPTRSTLLASRS